MSIIWNKKQKYLIDDISRWWKSSKQVYEFGGYAGTGKSTIFMHIISELGIPLHRIAAMSFIGQAAIIMRTKGLFTAKTIHSHLFNPILKPKVDDKGNIVMDTYFNRPKMELVFEPKPLYDIDLIIVDEAGSVPNYLKHDIESRGIKVLAAGDIGQLPPVGDVPAYLYNKDIIILDEIMRQREGSAILYLADRARKGLPIHKGLYGDVLVIGKDEITDRMIMNSDVVICGTNKTRDLINNRVRRDLLGIRSELPILNERLVCRKNNWGMELDGINLANGLCGVVTNMPGVHGFNGKTFMIDFKPTMLSNSFIGVECDYKYLIAPYDKRQLIKNNKYSVGEKFEYAYAVTCHMSQGSQYANGLYIEEFMNKDIHNNLNYTGITRFSNSLIFAKRENKYF